MIGVRHLVIFALTVLTARAALADAPGQVAPMPAAPPGYQWQLAPVAAPESEPSYYRGSMVLADAAAVAVFAATVHSPDTTSRLGYAIPGAVAFATFGPIVHGLHHNGTGAAHSVLLRVGLPLAGVAFASVALRCQGSSCYDGNNDAANMLLLGMAGALAAAVIDDGLLAHGQRREPSAWTPVLAPAARGGAAVGLSRSW